MQKSTQHKGYLKFKPHAKFEDISPEILWITWQISNIIATLQIAQRERNYQTLKIHIICKSLSKDYFASVQQLLLSKYWVLCLNALIGYFNNLYLTLTLDSLG